MNLDLILDALNLIVLIGLVGYTLRAKIKPAEPEPLQALVHNRIAQEIAANPTRTAKIAAYLRANPECRSFRKAAAIVDAE